MFTSYEAYLNRRDFYKQRRFICEITGHSGLTFFEALQSEVGNIVAELFCESLVDLVQDARISRDRQCISGCTEGTDFA